MKRIMLVAIVVGMIFIPVAVVYGGGPFERPAWQERQITVRTDLYPEAVPYPTARLCGERYRTISPPPAYVYERHERAETPPRAKLSHWPCEKKFDCVPSCKKSMTVKPYPSPCSNHDLKEIGRMSAELQKLERELGAAQERARTDSAEIRRLAEENGGLWELVRANQAWQSQYREWYREWQAKFK